MSALGTARNNWRILLLLVLVGAAVFFLFYPGAPISGAAADAGTSSNATAGITNIQYGIDLAGGARISAPTNGYLVTDAPVNESNRGAIVQAIASGTNATRQEVATSIDYGSYSGFPSENAIEVRADVDETALRESLANAGVDVSQASIQPGVSDYTVGQMVSVIGDRLSAGGFGGGSVTRVQTPNEPRDRVRIEAPGRDIGDLEELVGSQGRVELVAHFPRDNGSGVREEVLFTQERFDAGTVDDSGQRPAVPITLTQSAAEDMTEFMRDEGFAQGSLNNPSSCASLDPPDNEYCLLTKVDNETVYSAGLEPSLAQQYLNQPPERNRNFEIQASSVGEAQELLINMRSGALPTTLAFDDGSQALISPALAEDFRQNSLLTGVIAVIAVVLTVFARYGDPRVALPMAATALSEVVILLGFAAAVGWPLELSHVAGFIAVIGTGVDDLIIIADEVKAEGDVSSARVFQNRFRKAFWVIGAAAATTIIAMSPLAILNLGELRGFAIITILGVLIGVAVSRPAYGSILRSLTTDSGKRS